MKTRFKTTSKLVVGCLFAFVTQLLTSCTKDIDIPLVGFKEQLVVEGSIEPGRPPIVILSMSKDIYSPTNIESFLASFVNDAQVYVSNGTNETQLDLVCSNELPPGSEALLAGFFGLDLEQVSQYNLCVYTSINSQIWGEIGKEYTLRIVHQGKTYTGKTSILPPQGLDSLWWKPEPSTPQFGFTHARITDQAGRYDAYNWEVKRINIVSGQEQDPYFKVTFNSAVDDQFFDGISFDFFYENPWNIYDDFTPGPQRGKFKQGDTVVVKFSKIDKGVFDFLYSKTMQLMSSGNPFASTVNVKSNLQGGCLGVWAAYSPTYDTIICQ